MAKKDWQKEVRESAHRIWLAGLGALSRAEEEGSKLFSTLVGEGERFQSKGKVDWGDVRRDVEQAARRARRGAEGALGKLEETFDEQVARTLNRVGVPSRDEIAALARRVEELTRAVERLRERRGGATGRAGAKGGTGPAPKGGAPSAAGRGAAKSAGKSAAKSAAKSAGTSAGKGAAKSAGKGPAGRTRGPAGKGIGPRRGTTAVPERITTTEDVTTTADVRTAPR